jgi:uncharacterized protein (DUF2336 family)
MSKTFHLVIDATVEFCQLQRPTIGQKTQIHDLLIAYMDKLPSSDLKIICHHLARCEYAPKKLLLRLCELDADICRPILLSSPILQEADVKALIEGTDQIEHARIVARRLDLPTEISSILRAFEDDKIDRALDLRQRPLVQGTGNLKPEEIQIDNGIDATFLALCEEQNDVIIHTAFADRLGLELASCELLCNDLTSRNLPTAMKYMGLSETTAWAVYRRLANSTTNTSRVAVAFKATYNCLTREQCQLVINDWRMDELVMMARINSAANQSSTSAAVAKKSA